MERNISKIGADAKVAYLGPAGTHSHIAAMKIFGPTYDSGFVFHRTEGLANVLDKVRRGECAWGVVPYFNSTSEKVGIVYQELLDGKYSKDNHINIFASVSLPISHDLLGIGDLTDIKTVYSKQEAINQCRKYLDKYLPGIERVAVKSTAEAVGMVEKKGESAAALASRELIPFHRKLKVHEDCVQDRKDNTTRFLVISHDEVDLGELERRCDTWFAFSSSIQDGILTKVLGACDRWGIRTQLYEGTVTDAVTMNRQFLLEVPFSQQSLKTSFFMGEITHLPVRRIAQPLVPQKNETAIVREALKESGCIARAMEIHAQAASSFPGSGAASGKLPSGISLLCHDAVSNIESVWEKLGAPAERIVKTMVCVNESEELCLCAIPGKHQLDLNALNKHLGQKYYKATRRQIADHGLVLGAISPATRPEGSMLVVDPALPVDGFLLMGAGGDTCFSFVVDMRVFNWPKDALRVSVAVIPEEGKG